jgi:hypothetical protein
MVGIVVSFCERLGNGTGKGHMTHTVVVMSACVRTRRQTLALFALLQRAIFNYL